MKFRDLHTGYAVRTILLVCASVLFGISTMLAYVRGPFPAVVAFAMALFSLGGALLLQRRERNGAIAERSVWEQRHDELVMLLGLLQSLAITLCSELVTVCSTPGSGLPRQQVFKLVRTLDSMLADAGVDAEERESVKAGLHRQTAIEMPLPLARQINDSIDEKCRALRTLPTGSDAVGSDSERERQDRNRLRLIEAQKVDCEVLVRLTTTLDMFKSLTGALSNASCLSLAERSRLCEEMADDLSDLKEWVLRCRLRRPERWL
jgi:hypothetical protein